MRFLILDTCYPPFLRAHHQRHPDQATRSYDDQWRALMDTFFGTADFYSHALGELGHEAHEIVANSSALQLAWLRDRGRPARLPFRLARESIVEEQAREFRPDVVYVQNLHFFSKRLLRRLRGNGALIVGQIASEPPGPDKLRAFDLVLSSLPQLVSHFSDLGVRAEYLRLGFDPRVLRRLEEEHARRDTYGAVFVGALNRTQHRAGNATLEEAAHRTSLDFWGYRLDGRGKASPIRRSYHGEAWGIDMFRILFGARISLNRHLGAAGRYANNMRLYEATGVGSMLLTDAKSNLDELFRPGAEVVTYTNATDLAEHVDYFLENELERRAIAEAGQQRTLRDHTYTKRMEELLEILAAS